MHYSVLWLCILTALVLIGMWSIWMDKSHPAKQMRWSKFEHLLLFGMMYGACYLIFFLSTLGDSDDTKGFQIVATMVAGFYTVFNIYLWIKYRNKKWGAMQ